MPETAAGSGSCITSICFLETLDKSSAIASQLTAINEGTPLLVYVDASFRRVAIKDLVWCSGQTPPLAL